MRADRDHFTDHTLKREHRHPRAEPAGAALTDDERARETAGVAPDNVGGDRIAAENIAQVEQLGEVAIFGLELDQAALISPQLGELGLEAFVVAPDVDQIEIVAHEAGAAMR